MFGYCSLLHTLTDLNVSLFVRYECFSYCQIGAIIEASPYQRDFAITGSFAVCFS